MKPSRARAIIGIASVAASLAVYVSVGHGLHESIDGMSMHGLGICVVVLAAAAAVALASTAAAPFRIFVAPIDALPATVTRAEPLDARARASPAFLQRFLA